jgi:large subunit ribosomal protein L32
LAVPKQRSSHARSHKRKSQWLGSAKAAEMSACPHCGEMVRNYHACPECGYYKSRKVIVSKEEEE